MPGKRIACFGAYKVPGQANPFLIPTALFTAIDNT